uniref:Uncharacterized protein LOC105111589 n=1 Tax=Rhizophora mucronata TaxID=61149 RepID=A0A2P2JRI8_RHIMU
MNNNRWNIIELSSWVHPLCRSVQHNLSFSPTKACNSKIKSWLINKFSHLKRIVSCNLLQSHLVR